MRKEGSGVWLAGLLGLALLAGCGGTLATDPRNLPTSEVSGLWESDAAVGDLGQLELRLTRVEDTRVYEAELGSASGPGLGASEGYGTLAGGHLILDFGAGRPDEYYYEARVAGSGSGASLTGQFVFPGQTETLAVNFSYAGPLPAEE